MTCLWLFKKTYIIVPCGGRDAQHEASPHKKMWYIWGHLLTIFILISLAVSVYIYTLQTVLTATRLCLWSARVSELLLPSWLSCLVLLSIAFVRWEEEAGFSFQSGGRLRELPLRKGWETCWSNEMLELNHVDAIWNHSSVLWVHEMSCVFKILEIESRRFCFGWRNLFTIKFLFIMYF